MQLFIDAVSCCHESDIPDKVVVAGLRLVDQVRAVVRIRH